MTDRDIPNRYICKKCGAESPTGIGYVSGPDYNHTLSMGVRPDPACPNLHVYEYDSPIWDELGYTVQAKMEGTTMNTECTTVIDLADQLGVDPSDVAVYVDQLIGIDGENAVVVDSGDGRFLPAYIGNVGGTAYNVTLTPDAVQSIRLQFEAMGHQFTEEDDLD